MVVRSALGRESGGGECGIGPPEGAPVPLGTGQRFPGGSCPGSLALPCVLGLVSWKKIFLASWEVGSELR